MFPSRILHVGVLSGNLQFVGTGPNKRFSQGKNAIVKLWITIFFSITTAK